MTRLRFPTGTIELEGHLSGPAAPHRAAVLCHPHPQYGGSMDNDVIVTLAAALSDAGVAALRFNFRGVGGSGGRHGGGVEEVHDVAAAAAWLADRFPGAPISLVGYSFGAVVALRAGRDGLPGVGALVGVAPPVALADMTFLAGCALPVCLVAGEHDSFCDRAALEAVAATLPAVSVVWLPGLDHFFAGGASRVAEVVRRFVVDGAAP